MIVTPVKFSIHLIAIGIPTTAPVFIIDIAVIEITDKDFVITFLIINKDMGIPHREIITATG